MKDRQTRKDKRLFFIIITIGNTDTVPLLPSGLKEGSVRDFLLIIGYISYVIHNMDAVLLLSSGLVVDYRSYCWDFLVVTQLAYFSTNSMCTHTIFFFPCDNITSIQIWLDQRDTLIFSLDYFSLQVWMEFEPSIYSSFLVITELLLHV